VAGERSRAPRERVAPRVGPAVRRPDPEKVPFWRRPLKASDPSEKKPSRWGVTSRAAVPATAPSPAAGRRQWAAPLAALVAAMAVLGVIAGVSLRDPDAQARAERAAASQARVSIQQMLSYNYKTIDAQAAQIETLLTGSFKGEFTSAMDKDIKPLAVKNQTVVQARVSDVGVMSASPTTVKVLAFVNQAKVGVDQKDPVVDQNRVIATLTKVGDRWLISKVEAF
jgi:Mce-associated membrane protein